MNIYDIKLSYLLTLDQKLFMINNIDVDVNKSWGDLTVFELSKFKFILFNDDENISGVILIEVFKKLHEKACLELDKFDKNEFQIGNSDDLGFTGHGHISFSDADQAL
jgi:hypothetical protein